MMNSKAGFWMRIGLILTLVLSIGLINVHPVQAAEIDNDGIIEAGETINDDVILGSDTVVVMDGTVNGMLVAGGETVTINGTVNGDAFLFGAKVIISESAVIDGNLFIGCQSAEVNGKVTGSLAGGSSSMTLENVEIARNVYYGGYSFEALKNSKIGTDLFVGGYQALLHGEIGRDASVSSAAVEVDGTIARNARFDVASASSQGMPVNMYMPDYAEMPASVAPGIRIAPEAVIGDLTYTSPEEQSSAIQTQPEGGIVYQTPVPDSEQTSETINVSRNPFSSVPEPLRRVADMIRNIVSLLILGALVIWKLPKLLKRTVETATDRPWASAGTGLLVIVIGYAGSLFAAGLILLVGILLALVTLGSLSSAFMGIGFAALALIMAVFSLLVTFGSKIIAAYLVGDMLMEKVAPQNAQRNIWALVAGVLIYSILRAIPFVGWIFGLAATLVGMGAMWFVYRAWRQPEA